MKQTPEIGDSVYYFPPKEDVQARANFNEGVVAATITRVFTGGIVSLKVFPDSGPVGDRTSVNHYSLTKGTRSWFFKGEYPLDEKGVPIFVEAGEAQRTDTISTSL